MIKLLHILRRQLHFVSWRLCFKQHLQKSFVVRVAQHLKILRSKRCVRDIIRHLQGVNAVNVTMRVACVFTIE